MDIITTFRKENLNPKDIKGIFMDNVDYGVSFGQTNNIKRFLGYINFKLPNYFKEELIVMTITEENYNDIEELKALISEKFVNLRLKRNYEE